MKFLSAFFLLLCFSTLSFAQTNEMALPPPLTPNELWRQDGQMVTVRVSRKSPIRIFVVGREEAKINPSNLRVTVRRAQPYPAKELKVDQYNNYYVVSDPAEANNITDLEITTHMNDQTGPQTVQDEVFHFNLNQRAP